ncbi:60S ribosomal protein [Vigna angularis]|uniref:60S ribosomal protein n=1 Tax=Phaseolus angularis TaxID=3914 RepID=A0A8T0KV57_PHAAN|nr:60S ribosomal protein [Vigna angularis]
MNVGRVGSAGNKFKMSLGLPVAAVVSCADKTVLLELILNLRFYASLLEFTRAYSKKIMRESSVQKMDISKSLSPGKVIQCRLQSWPFYTNADDAAMVRLFSSVSCLSTSSSSSCYYEAMMMFSAIRPDMSEELCPG